MSSPSYTLLTFNWDEGNTRLFTSVSQTIDGQTWINYKTITGDAASTIWTARGETEDQLIARILAA